MKIVKNNTQLPIKLIKKYLPKKIEELQEDIEFICKNENKINQYC